jgi:outer membrane lipase/esterase
VGQWRAIVAGGGQHQDFDGQHSAASADGNGYNLNIGGSYRVNDAWRVGLAAGFYNQKLEAGDADFEYKLNSYMGTAFAQYQQNRWWGDLAMTAGKLDYDALKRKFQLGVNERGEKGDTDGYVLAISGRIGYDIAQQASSPWHLSPFVSADFGKTEVDGYSEKGADSTALPSMTSRATRGVWAWVFRASTRSRRRPKCLASSLTNVSTTTIARI